MIDGQPMIVVKTDIEYAGTEDGDVYLLIPLSLSDTIEMMIDGKSLAVEVDGTYLLLPVEDGIERVCISEFDVEIVDGRLVLVHETNPIWKVAIAAVKIGAGTAFGAWDAHRDGRCAWAGAATGAAVGAASTVAMAKTAGTWVATAIRVGYGGHIAAKLASPGF